MRRVHPPLQRHHCRRGSWSGMRDSPRFRFPTPAEIKELPRRLRRRPGSREEGALGRGLQPLQARLLEEAGAAAASWPESHRQRRRRAAEIQHPPDPGPTGSGQGSSWPSRWRGSSTSRSRSPTPPASPKPATSARTSKNICIQNLLHNADYDVEKASRGIVYIDEIDKIARKGDIAFADARCIVGGEGVQQALLKIIEGTRAPTSLRAAARSTTSRNTSRSTPPTSSSSSAARSAAWSRPSGAAWA